MAKTKVSFLPLVSFGALLFLLLVTGYWLFGEAPTFAVFGAAMTFLALVSVFPSRFTRLEQIIDAQVSPQAHYIVITLAVCLALVVLFYLSANYRLNVQLERKNG